MNNKKLFLILMVCSALAILSTSFSPKIGLPPSPTILIQPLPSITPAQIENLRLRLQHHLPNAQVVSAKQMPAMAYYEPRHRFKTFKHVDFIQHRRQK